MMNDEQSLGWNC